jgi:hypothetical protein
MATKSGFSKGWKGFVDHKWSKKHLGTSFAVVWLERPFQEFVCAIGRYRKFPDDIAAWQRHPTFSDAFSSDGRPTRMPMKKINVAGIEAARRG